MLLEREDVLERRCSSVWRLAAAMCAGLALMLLTGAWGLSAGPEPSGSKAKFANFVYPGDRDDDDDADEMEQDDDG